MTARQAIERVNAQRLPKGYKQAHWNQASHSGECVVCEGHGKVWNQRGTGHANDPSSGMVECAMCEGTGKHACAVCGNDIEAKGYDCLVCDMVNELPTADLNPAELADLCKSVMLAVTARRTFEGYAIHAADRAFVPCAQMVTA